VIFIIINLEAYVFLCFHAVLHFCTGRADATMERDPHHSDLSFALPHLEHSPDESNAGAGANATSSRLATFRLDVPDDLPGAFSDANLFAASPDIPTGALTDHSHRAGTPRLRVAYSLDRQHVEALKRGLWPSDARYLGQSSGGGVGGGFFAPLDGP
jgi:hypothetical protein